MTKLWKILSNHFQIERVPMVFLVLMSILGFLLGSMISCLVYGLLSLSLSKLFLLCIVGGYGCVLAFLGAILYEYRHI